MFAPREPDSRNPEYERLVGQAQQLVGSASCAEWNAAEMSVIRRADVVPYVDDVNVTFARGAEMPHMGGRAVPAAIRMTE